MIKSRAKNLLDSVMFSFLNRLRLGWSEEELGSVYKKTGGLSQTQTSSLGQRAVFLPFSQQHSALVLMPLLIYHIYTSKN